MGIFRQPVLLSVKLARIANFGLIGIIIAYYTAGTLVSMFQCSPIEKAWIGATEGKCIDNTQFRVANAYINAFTSISLVIMPFPVLLATEHRSKELWQFLGLISIGLAYVEKQCARSKISCFGANSACIQAHGLRSHSRCCALRSESGRHDRSSMYVQRSSTSTHLLNDIVSKGMYLTVVLQGSTRPRIQLPWPRSLQRYLSRVSSRCAPVSRCLGISQSPRCRVHHERE